MEEEKKTLQKEVAGGILDVANELNGLANLFDMAADSLVNNSERNLSYTGIIGIGAILGDISGNLGELADKLDSDL